LTIARRWRVALDATAAKELRKLAPSDRQRILKFLRERLSTEADPRRLGAALSGPFSGLWRYRVGDFRLIAAIEDEQVTILVLRIGHRREIYR
jgi:mRNA interferase RelE/StbE